MGSRTPGDGHFTQNFVPIAGVALAGIIQVSSQSGPFGWWNVMIGVPLVLLLAAHVPRSEMTPFERLAWSSTWGFTLMSAAGVFLQAAYRAARGLPKRFPTTSVPFLDEYGRESPEWEAPAEYYLAVWLVLTASAYVYLRMTRKPAPDPKTRTFRLSRRLRGRIAARGATNVR